MTLTRRRLLSASGLLTTGLLAGCVARGGGNGTPTDTPTGSPSPTPTSTPTPTPDDDPLPGGPGVSLVGTDPAPDLPVRPGVEVVESVATADGPPVLRVSLTNASDGTVTVGEGRAVRFQYVVDGAGILQLLPAGEDYPVAPGNCWRLTDGIAVTEEYRTEELAPGETITADVALYALPDYDGCLPVGEFRFETTLAVLDEGAADRRADWGFTVLLE